MQKTKVVNQTGSILILKEGTANVFRMLCSNLQDGKAYSIKVDPNATYREYWCAVTADDDKHVVLSSDDCMEYEEVRIKLKSDNTDTYTWDAVKRSTHELVLGAGDKAASRQHQAQVPGGTGGTANTREPSDAGDKAASRQHQAQAPGGTGGTANTREPSAPGKLWNKIKGWFP